MFCFLRPKENQGRLWRAVIKITQGVSQGASDHFASGSTTWPYRAHGTASSKPPSNERECDAGWVVSLARSLEAHPKAPRLGPTSVGLERALLSLNTPPFYAKTHASHCGTGFLGSLKTTILQGQKPPGNFSAFQEFGYPNRGPPPVSPSRHRPEKHRQPQGPKPGSFHAAPLGCLGQYLRPAEKAPLLRLGSKINAAGAVLIGQRSLGSAHRYRHGIRADTWVCPYGFVDLFPVL